MIDYEGIKRMAENHWSFIEGLLFSLPDKAQFGVSTIEYLYKEAFIHGWGHGEECERNRRATNEEITRQLSKPTE